MKAVVKTAEGVGNVALLDVPSPSCGDYEVKIKVMAVGICGTDIKIMQGGAWSNPPVILGHEYAGVVAEVGKNVTEIHVGDRVISETAQVVCGKCSYCLSGNILMCDERLSIGYGVNGAMAEYCVVREGIVHKIPDGLDFDSAALAEPTAVAVHAALDHVHLEKDEWVLVSGCGAIGLLVAQIMKSIGCHVIITGISPDKRRLEVAKELGCDYAVNVEADDLSSLVMEVTNHIGVSAVFECSGAESSVRAVMPLLKKTGKLVQVGLTKPDLTINYALLPGREISLIGTFGHVWSSWETALELLGSGKVQTKPIITHHFPLEEWEKAFEIARGGEGIKVLLHPKQ